MSIDTKLFINGEFRNSADGATFVTINPATEKPICTVHEATAADIDDAVSGARAAFQEWNRVEASERASILIAIAAAISEHGDDLAYLDCIDSGKPISDAKEDVHAAVGMFQYFAGMCDKIEGRTIPAFNNKLVYTRREPYGVFAAITAWNYPLFNECAKIAPIIASGNACVLKPAEETPLTALRLAEIIASVNGVPRGLVNVVNGSGETTGRLLVAHPGVDRVSFTGSTETGHDILRNISETKIKGVTFELGGKAPIIVCDDANIEAAANAIAFSGFYNQGQTCTAATRILTHVSVVDELTDRLIEQATSLKCGMPEEESTLLGPLISQAQYSKVLGYIERARGRGMHPVVGGHRDPAFDHGYFILPTIYSDVTPDDELFQDEIFGPLLTISTFETLDAAVDLANKTRYGLAASIWSRNSFTINTTAKGLRAGVIWANTLFSEFPGSPAGGYGDSGFGREYGFDGVGEYTQVKTVWINLDDSYDRWM